MVVGVCGGVGLREEGIVTGEVENDLARVCRRFLRRAFHIPGLDLTRCTMQAKHPMIMIW
jgi:hypothetical protein